MTGTRGTVTCACIFAAALVVVAGCSSAGGGASIDSPAPPTTSGLRSPTPSSLGPSSPSPSPSSSSTPTDAGYIAENQVQAFVPIYLAVLDKLYSAPTVSINDIYTVAVQPESTDDAAGIAKYRSSNYRQTGTQKLVEVYGTSVNMSGLGGSSANSKYPTVQLTACVDVSGIKVTDAQGKVVGDPNNPEYLIESLRVVNINYPSSAGWRVSNAPNRQAHSCAGS